MPPLSSDKLLEAKAIAKSSQSEQEFKTQANASDIRWWDATVPQVNEIKNENAKEEVKLIVTAYCKKVALNLGAAFASGQQVVSTTDRWGWFRYYLMECNMVSGLQQAQKSAIEDVYNELLYKTDAVTVALKYKSFNDIPAGRLRSILTRLLQLGFIKVPVTNQALDTFDEHLQGMISQYSGNKAHKMRWRADSRPYNDIRDAGGFLAKGRSDLGNYAIKQNMREPWHPFSDPAIRSYMWFRKGQGDNCLFAVVSIGKDAKEWKTYLPFPLLRDTPWSMKKMTLTCQVITKKNDQELKKFEPIEMIVSYTWVYLFVLADLMVLNTGELGTQFGHNTFPELGVGEIPLKNIYGAVQFARIYHGEVPKSLDAAAGADLDKKGFTAFPIKWVEPPSTAFYYSDHPTGVAPEKLRMRFQELKNPNGYALRWSPTGIVELPSLEREGRRIEFATAARNALR